MRKDYITNWSTQFKKSILPIIILSYLSKRKCYGYLILSLIKNELDIKVTEGTIYPILNKLNQVGYISYEWVEQEVGMPRKYYFLTQSGKNILKILKTQWIDISNEISYKVIHSKISLQAV